MITALTQKAEDAEQSQADKTNKSPSVVSGDSMQEIVAMQGPPNPATPRSVIQDQDLGLLAEGADYLQPLLLGSDKASTAERANPGHASVSFAHYPLAAPRS
jgi:hypothetical protein